MRCRISGIAYAVALRGFAVPLFALAAATGAIAAEATIGGVSFSLPLPASFCELSAHAPSDSNLITSTSAVLGKAGNTLLAMSADCQQLDDWRAHRRPFLDDYVEYQTPTGQMDQMVTSPEAAIQQSCAGLRAQGAQIASDLTPNVKAIFESTLKTIRLNETKFIGVVGEDRTACYAGLVSKIQTQSGTEKTQIVLFAITIVKNKVVLIYRFAVYTGSDIAITDLLAKLKGTTAALYAANK